MMRLIQLTAVTKVERHAATSLALDAINQLGGWVEDTQFYSNKMVNIRFVMPQHVVPSFVDRLQQEGILASVDGGFDIRDGDAEQPGSLQLTFIHNEPDLKLTIPAIPG